MIKYKRIESATITLFDKWVQAYLDKHPNVVYFTYSHTPTDITPEGYHTAIILTEEKE